MTTNKETVNYNDLAGYYDTILKSHQDILLISRTYLYLEPIEFNYTIFIVKQPNIVNIEDFELKVCVRIYNKLVNKTI